MGACARRWIRPGAWVLVVLGCAAAAEAAAPQSAIETGSGGSSGETRGLVSLITVNVSLHQGALSAQELTAYTAILQNFANAVYEATDGRHVIGTVNLFLDGRPIPFGVKADIVWMPRGVPSMRVSGGVGTAGGHLVMFDVFQGGDAGVDLDFLATAESRRIGGAILAHLWLKYFLGLDSEYAVLGNDVPVTGSILHDPISPAVSQTPAGFNMSVRGDGDPDNGFGLLEDTGRTPQHRLNGVSAWATVARTYGEDPKSGRLIAKRPRTFYPELNSAAPAGSALPTLNDGPAPAVNVQIFDNPSSTVTLVNERTATRVDSTGARDVIPSGVRTIDVSTEPQTFEWTADSTLLTMTVIVQSPLSGEVSNLEITLTDPEGRIRLPALSTDTLVAYQIAPSVTGVWRLRLEARALQARLISFTVTAVPAVPTGMLQLDLVPAPSNLASPLLGYPVPAVLQANVTRGLGIRNVELEATVQLPTGTRVPVEFHDDGRSPDVVANDGSYAANFGYTQAGVHNVEVVARNTGSARMTYVGTSRAPARDTVGQAVNVPPPAEILVGEPFVRTATLGFVVTNLLQDDHGNVFVEATPVPFTNADVPGRIDTPADTDVFSFTVPPARGVLTRDVVLRLTSVSGSGTPQFRLFDTDGTTQLSIGNVGPSGYLRIRRMLSVGGTYFASVTPGSADARTTYSFSVGPPIPSDTTPLGVGLTVPPEGGGGGGGGGGCFIATAAYGTPLEHRIDLLRTIRDRSLLPHASGTAFVDTYYRLSPPIADTVARVPVVRALVRAALALLLMALQTPAASGAAVLVSGLGVVAWVSRRRKALARR